MKKINVNKSDGTALIVEKIIEADSKQVVLIIPRFSSLAESLNNFRLLKREAEALNKKIFIESVDNRVIELAELAGIEAINPFFVKNKRQFSDIIPKKEKTSQKIKSAEGWKTEEGEVFIEKLANDLYGAETAGEEKYYGVKNNGVFEKQKPSDSEEKTSFLKKLPIKTSIVLIVLGLMVYGAVTVLPRADLKIVAKKAEWSYNDSVVTEKKIDKTDYKTLTILNQLFNTSGNTGFMLFPATGKKQVENKASGKITIYNSYSSDAQTLLQNTRFLSPEGKIFRLVKKIVVPGAKISEGKIIPSSIDADVIAEEAGDDYNIGPVKFFSIPGFKGSPKYQAFYGESKEAMKGGFVGEVSYPTPSDIAAAAKKAKETLESNLKTTIYSQIPVELKILDGASVFSVLKQVNNEEVDKDGKFSVSVEGQLTILAFKEADLIDVLKARAEAEKGDQYYVKTYDLQYGVVRMDADSGRLSFPVNFKAVLSYKIDIENLKKEIAEKSDIELRKLIFSLPGLDTANVSLWPFWVKKVPANLNKINISID